MIDICKPNRLLPSSCSSTFGCSTCLHAPSLNLIHVCRTLPCTDAPTLRCMCSFLAYRKQKARCSAKLQRTTSRSMISRQSIRKAASWLLCTISHACLFGQFREESLLPYVLDMKLTNRIRDHLPGIPTVQGIRQGPQDVLSRAKTPATPSVVKTRPLWGHVAMTKRMPCIGVTSFKSRFPRLVSLPTPLREENAVQTAPLE